MCRDVCTGSIHSLILIKIQSHKDFFFFNSQTGKYLSFGSTEIKQHAASDSSSTSRYEITCTASSQLHSVLGTSKPQRKMTAGEIPLNICKNNYKMG